MIWHLAKPYKKLFYVEVAKKLKYYKNLKDHHGSILENQIGIQTSKNVNKYYKVKLSNKIHKLWYMDVHTIGSTIEFINVIEM